MKLQDVVVNKKKKPQKLSISLIIILLPLQSFSSPRILQIICKHFAAEVLKKKSFSGWIDTSISLVSCFRIQYYVEIMKDVVVNKEPQMLLISLIIILLPLQNLWFREYYATESCTLSLRLSDSEKN